MGKACFLLAALAAAALSAAAAAGPRATATVVATLTPGEEVQAPGLAGGRATFRATIDTVTGRVCWTFTGVRLTEKPTAAHIHQGVRGGTGAGLVSLGAGNRGYVPTGCAKPISGGAAFAGTIAQHPEIFYVNIHTKRHLDGAIRGQLKKG